MKNMEQKHIYPLPEEAEDKRAKRKGRKFTHYEVQGKNNDPETIAENRKAARDLAETVDSAYKLADKMDEASRSSSREAGSAGIAYSFSEGSIEGNRLPVDERDDLGARHGEYSKSATYRKEIPGIIREAAFRFDNKTRKIDEKYYRASDYDAIGTKHHSKKNIMLTYFKPIKVEEKEVEVYYDGGEFYDPLKPEGNYKSKNKFVRRVEYIIDKDDPDTVIVSRILFDRTLGKLASEQETHIHSAKFAKKVHEAARHRLEKVSREIQEADQEALEEDMKILEDRKREVEAYKAK